VWRDQLSVLVSRPDDPDSLQRTLRTVTQDLPARAPTPGSSPIALVSEGEQPADLRIRRRSIVSIPDSLRQV